MEKQFCWLHTKINKAISGICKLVVALILTVQISVSPLHWLMDAT